MSAANIFVACGVPAPTREVQRKTTNCRLSPPKSRSTREVQPDRQAHVVALHVSLRAPVQLGKDLRSLNLSLVPVPAPRPAAAPPTLPHRTVRRPLTLHLRDSSTPGSNIMFGEERAPAAILKPLEACNRGESNQLSNWTIGIWRTGKDGTSADDEFRRWDIFLDNPRGEIGGRRSPGEITAAITTPRTRPAGNGLLAGFCLLGFLPDG